MLSRQLSSRRRRFNYVKANLKSQPRKSQHAARFSAPPVTKPRACFAAESSMAGGREEGGEENQPDVKACVHHLEAHDSYNQAITVVMNHLEAP